MLHSVTGGGGGGAYRLALRSFTRGWGGVKFSGKMRYVTLEWPLTLFPNPDHSMGVTLYKNTSTQFVHECFVRVKVCFCMRVNSCVRVHVRVCA